MLGLPATKGFLSKPRTRQLEIHPRTKLFTSDRRQPPDATSCQAAAPLARNAGSSRRSWKRSTEKYMKPFSIDVYISARHVHAKIVHRVTSKVVAVATTSSRDLRESLLSLTSASACAVIGKLIAEKAMEADVYAVTYVPRKDQTLQDKLEIVLNAVRDSGVAVL